MTGILQKLLTEKETAAALGTPASTLRYWRFKGTGPEYLKLGARLVRYKQSVIEDYIQSSVRMTTQEEGSHHD